jgi:hypothetical protein
MSAPLILGGCAAGAPASVPFAVRLLIFVVVAVVVSGVVFGAWMVLRTTPVPVSGKDSAHE